MERVRPLVDAAVQQLADAELLDAASYLVGGAAQEVVRLGRGRNQRDLYGHARRDRQERHPNHSAPHGRREEVVLVGDVEVLQPVLLEGGGEVLRLLLDQVLAGVEVFGDEVEEAPRRGPRGQVVGLDGDFDVQDLGVGAQQVPGHVHLHEHQLVVDDLRRWRRRCEARQ